MSGTVKLGCCLNLVSRQEVTNYCQAENAIRDKFIVIMAWGGARRKHIRSLLEEDVLGKFLEKIANADSRSKAFKIYQDERAKGNWNGLGISFVTKIIFFLMRKTPPGYILDQWTAKSMRLLSPLSNIALTSTGLPDPKITPEDYQQFCLFIENLAKRLDCSPDEAEAQIFSEGRGNGVWREYLKKHIY